MRHVIGSKIPRSESMPICFHTLEFDHSWQQSPPLNHVAHPQWGGSRSAPTDLYGPTAFCGGAFAFATSTWNHRASDLEGTFLQSFL